MTTTFRATRRRAETGAELQWLRQEQAAHQQRMAALEAERAAADAAHRQQLADLEAQRAAAEAAHAQRMAGLEVQTRQRVAECEAAAHERETAAATAEQARARVSESI